MPSETKIVIVCRFCDLPLRRRDNGVPHCPHCDNPCVVQPCVSCYKLTRRV